MTLMVMNSRFCNQNQDSLSFYQEFESSHRLKQQEAHHPHFSESLTCGSQNGFWSPNGQAGHHINSEYFMKSNFLYFLYLRPFSWKGCQISKAIANMVVKALTLA